MASTKGGGRNAVFEDLSNVEFETSEDVEVIDKFKNMNLKEELMRGIFAYGNTIQDTVTTVDRNFTFIL